RLNRVKQQLQQSSYKLTPQREATVRVLIENEMRQCVVSGNASDDSAASPARSAYRFTASYTLAQQVS
ncbi:hypothetical protein ABZW16_25255, partial [Nocardia sp. NPDC004604]